MAKLRNVNRSSRSGHHGNGGTHFEVETCHDGQLLHRQLLGGLLVTMATTTLDFGTTTEVLWPREPASGADASPIVR